MDSEEHEGVKGIPRKRFGMCIQVSKEGTGYARNKDL